MRTYLPVLSMPTYRQTDLSNFHDIFFTFLKHCSLLANCEFSINQVASIKFD